MNIDHVLELFLVGQVADIDGEPIFHDDYRPIQFASAVIRMHCGYTGDGKLSMGHNGLEKNIMVDTFKYHDTKESVYDILEERKVNIDDMYPIDDYMKSVLTDAARNNLYRKMFSWRVWIHGDFNLMKWEQEQKNETES